MFTDLLAPELEDAIDFIEVDDIVTYTAPNGKAFTAKVIGKAYDETIAHEDGTWGVWLIAANVWYLREDGFWGIMRRELPETAVSLVLKANAT